MSVSNINVKDHIEGETIDLSICNISVIPLPQIAVFTRITTLNFSGNKLTSLPPNFGSELAHIVQLDLSSNKLKALPETFYELSNLVHLDLYRNEIRDLPASLHHLKKLKFLDISENPLNPRIRGVVGLCSTQKECTAAARNIVQHFTRQKETLLKEKKMAKQHKADERKEAATQKVVKNDKKAAKKPENKPVKQQNSHKAASNNVKQQSNSKAQKKQVQQKSKRSSSSSFFTFNKLFLLVLLAGIGYTFHAHCEGDYSTEGVKAAVPRIQKSFHIFVNESRIALKPENLRETGKVVFAKSNATAYIVGGHVKDAAYKTQDFLEQYTGDLTPYTSKVSYAAGVAMGWLSVQAATVYAWLSSQDWQGAYDVCAHYLTLAYTTVVDICTAIGADPRFQAAHAWVCGFCCTARTVFKRWLTQAAEYLAENVPLWLELAKEQGIKMYAAVQSKIDSMVN